MERLSDEVLHIFLEYPWPGNVREFENILGRAIINMKFSETVIELDHLPTFGKLMHQQRFESLANSDDHQVVIKDEILPLNNMISKWEKKYIEQILAQTNGNKTKAAKLLEISIRSLYYKMEKFGLQ